jgi:hypothetical protein
VLEDVTETLEEIIRTVVGAAAEVESSSGSSGASDHIILSLPCIHDNVSGEMALYSLPCIHDNGLVFIALYS